MSFVFYDTETTGLHKSFDQILQFAAIKTDWQLEEVDRFEIRCRLLPHVVPHPQALCLTGSGMGTLLDPSLPSHYEMMCAITAKLADWSPATFIGYYSLGFDEHLLRQAFYQCLQYPYLTSSRPNSRTDALGIVHAAAALAPGSFRVPILANGRPSFSLANLAFENGFPHTKAHDALADVEAMIHACRHASREVPQIWSNALRFSQKAAVAEFLEDETIFVLTQTYSGNAYHFAVTKVGADPSDTNAVFVIDLNADVEELHRLDDAALASRLEQTPKIVRKIRTNASPTMTPLEDGEEFEGLPVDEWRERGTRIRKDKEFCKRLLQARLATREPWPESEHVEERLYDGLFLPTDNTLMREFHVAAWQDRAEIVRGFGDRRLKQLGNRLLFFERPDLLPETDRRRFEEAIARRILGYGYEPAPWLTLDAAREAADEMADSAAESEREILDGLRAYVHERAEHARGVLNLT